MGIAILFGAARHSLSSNTRCHTGPVNISICITEVWIDVVQNATGPGDIARDAGCPKRTLKDIS